MKAGMIGTIALGILVLLSAIILTISGKNVRKSELQTSLSAAIEQTMNVMYLDKTYEIQNEHEFIADFLGNLLVQLDSNSNITVKILNLDILNGLFDVQASQKYRHFTGQEGIVTCRKTVILEEYKSFEEVMHQVVFQRADGSIYKAFTIYEGSLVMEPDEKPEGFIRWEKINPDGSSDISWDGLITQMRVNSDLILRAVCN